MLVVAEDLVGRAIIEHRESGANPRQAPKAFTYRSLSAGLLTLESFSQRDEHGVGQALARRSREGPRQLVGFVVLDAQGHEGEV